MRHIYSQRVIILLNIIFLLFNGRSCFESRVPKKLISGIGPEYLPQKGKVPLTKTSLDRTYRTCNSYTTAHHDVSSKESIISDQIRSEDQGHGGSGHIGNFVEQANDTVPQQAQPVPVMSYDQLIQIIDNRYINEQRKDMIKDLLNLKLSICAGSQPGPRGAHSSFFNTLLNQFDNNVEDLLNTMEDEIDQPYAAEMPSRQDLQKLLDDPNMFSKEIRERIETHFHEQDPYNDHDAFVANFSDYFRNGQDAMLNLALINTMLEDKEKEEEDRINMMTPKVELLMQHQMGLALAEQNQADIDTMCNICQEEGARPLPCKHYFHIGCIMRHLVRSQNCPFCRADVVLPQ